MSDKKKVLVVDDNAELTEVLADKLAIEGFDTDVAHDGEEGLKKALDTHPDLILLDIMMPKMDGWETLTKLKEDEWGKTANVILLTNLNDMENISKAVEEGKFDYLVKTDWDVADIVEKIRTSIESNS